MAQEKSGELKGFAEYIQEQQETYKPPAGAASAAKKALRWRDEHGDEVKAMTHVGWTRANQLAKRENLSYDTVKRMARFARHKKNSVVNPKYKDTPWKDRGLVAWLGWGGDAGVNWAQGVVDRVEKQKSESVIYEGEGNYESWEDGYKRRVVKTTDKDHKEDGYNWRIKGKDRNEVTIKLYKKKPSFDEFKKQMKRVAGHEFGG